MRDDHFLVVGGTRGIGRALATHLVRTERVASVLGRHPNPEDVSPRLAGYPVDAADADAVVSAIDAAVERSGKLTAAVFLQRYRGDDLSADLTVALKSTSVAIDHMVTTRAFAPNASIVLVSSIAGHYIAPEQPLGYHVSKAGLEQLGRYYALRLGPHGLRVNTVSPCVVIKDEAREFYESNRWVTERYERFIPLGRAGRPQDIVNAILFLASDEAAYITGQNIVVDGGLTLRSHESIIRDFPREGE